MPYVVSGAMTGLGLIIMGATLIDVSVRRQDSRERRAQFTQLDRALAATRAMLVDTGSRPETREEER